MKLLLTGFEPFGESKINPSEQVVRALEREKIAGIELRTAILPVDRVRGPEALIRAVQQLQPDAVLCLGEASRRMAISIERVAINLLDFRIADDLRKPFFQPRVTMHMIPVPLPKSRLVIRHELDATQPFRRFPKVQMRHEQTQWIAVLRFERFVVVLVREHDARSVT
jgi:hypothetical protein